MQQFLAPEVGDKSYVSVFEPDRQGAAQGSVGRVAALLNGSVALG